MTNLINCGTCGYPLTPEERTSLIERDGVMVKPAPVTKDQVRSTEEALDLALEALENTTPTGFNMERDKQFYAAITAIKQARSAPVREHLTGLDIYLDPNDGLKPKRYPAAQPAPVQSAERGEPVFCEYCGGNDDADFGLPTDHCTDCARPQPAAQPAEWQKIECPICGDMAVATDIPAAQRQWVGLTDEEKQEWVEAMPDEPKPRHIMNLINVIEVELKGRNT
jgi:hypothetical protein